MPHGEESRRESARQGVLKSARLVMGGRVLDCLVLDLSDRGARVRLEAATAVADRVTLCLRGGAAFEAVRRWVRWPEMGLEFTGPAALTAQAAERATELASRLRRSGVAEVLAQMQELRDFDDPGLARHAAELRAAWERLAAALEAHGREGVHRVPDLFTGR